MTEHENFSDELISAFLDGELTSDEQAQVERMLASSAEHRQMFDELKSLRSGLQSLPRYELDDEFCQRVLRRAERAMLGSTPGELTSAPESKPVAGTTLSPTPQHLERGSWRGVVWAVAAVAAALVLMTFVSRDWESLHLAQAPESDSHQKVSTNVPAESQGGPDPAARDSSVESLELPHAADAPVSVSRSAPTASSSSIAANSAPQTETLPAADKSQALEPALAPAKPAAAAAVAASPPAPPMNYAASPAVAPAQNGLADASAARALQPESLAAGFGGTGNAGPSAQPWAAMAPPDELLVVHVDVSREALQKRAFDRSLAVRRIDFSSEVAQNRSALSPLGEAAALREEASAAGAGGSPAREAKKGPEATRAHDLLRKTADLRVAQAMPDAGLDLVYVEAPADEIEGLLADMKAQPELFLALAVNAGSAEKAKQIAGASSQDSLLVDERTRRQANLGSNVGPQPAFGAFRRSEAQAGVAPGGPSPASLTPASGGGAPASQPTAAPVPTTAPPVAAPAPPSPTVQAFKGANRDTKAPQTSPAAIPSVPAENWPNGELNKSLAKELKNQSASPEAATPSSPPSATLADDSQDNKRIAPALQQQGQGLEKAVSDEQRRSSKENADKKLDGLSQHANDDLTSPSSSRGLAWRLVPPDGLPGKNDAAASSPSPKAEGYEGERGGVSPRSRAAGQAADRVAAASAPADKDQDRGKTAGLLEAQKSSQPLVRALFVLRAVGQAAKPVEVPPAAATSPAAQN